ncbi:MAG: hypothetical protein M1539_04950 [Actinobacteria bacterium]|nr:hypothetical protein [Actinomycetota bacterium]
MRNNDRMRQWNHVILGILIFSVLAALALSGCNAVGYGQKIRDSNRAAISADGRFVAFVSYDPDLRDRLNIDCTDRLCWEVYVTDMETGEVTLASSDSSGKPAAAVETPWDVGNYPLGGTDLSPFSKAPTSVAISSDGRFVLFSSYTLPPANGQALLFRKDMQSGELALVSTPPAISETRATFFYPAMSSDGRFIAYWTFSPPTAGSGAKFFVRDMTQAAPEPVSLADVLPTGMIAMPIDAPNAVDISLDGRQVALHAFLSTSPGSNLSGVFIKDRSSGEAHMISTSSMDEGGNGPSVGASISDDGKLAVFESGASNLAPEKTCEKIAYSCTNVYLKDVQSGKTKLLSKDDNGAAMNNAVSPVISSDGSTVAFVVVRSISPTDKTEPDTSTPAVQETIYLTDLRTGEMRAVTPEPASPQATPPPFLQSRLAPALRNVIAGYQGIGISADGSRLVFPALSNWMGMEDRMCHFRRSKGRETPEALDTTPPDPCVEIFGEDVASGEVFRLSTPEE